MGNRDRAMREAHYICDMAPIVDERTGQLLFNFLRHEIAEVVRDTELDTFYDQLSFDDVVDWLDDHIEYDDEGTMVRLVSEHDVLWEEEQYAA